ncbi:hypothetical protein ACIQHV_18055 [Bacillus bombysepticus]|uniref:hypothetical protein n=1 Tax=Bacillus cereus group TaxID=86661 RepID=UPI0020CC7AF1|nr:MULTISPECIES: hypothetical protein [Bacillus cereus group]MEC2872252.1 hypothetical protein [Bacillus cereus]
MKMPLTKHWCLDRNCGFEETSHKIRDGWKCPHCNGPIMSQQLRNKKKAVKVDEETAQTMLRISLL